MEGFFIEFIVVAMLLLIPAWRIFRKAGFEPAIALVVLIPLVGPLVAMAILALAEWPSHKYGSLPEGDA